MQTSTPERAPLQPCPIHLLQHLASSMDKYTSDQGDVNPEAKFTLFELGGGVKGEYVSVLDLPRFSEPREFEPGETHQVQRGSS